MTFNPNELILEKVRSVEEYNPSTLELTGRYTQIESPSLKTSANGQDVVDAMGTPITTFYNAQTGTFDFTNSLFSLDLASSQYGTTKKVASDTDKIIMPVSEILAVGADHKVVLKYVPVGTSGAEVKYVKVINANNTYGETYTVSATAGEGKFTLDASTKTITLPDNVTGRVFVNYNKETSTAVKVTKNTDGVPETKMLQLHCIFHDPCDTNKVYAGVILIQRAQIDPSSTEINLTPDGKHSASYKLQKPYCDEDAKLFDILVSED